MNRLRAAALALTISAVSGACMQAPDTRQAASEPTDAGRTARPNPVPAAPDSQPAAEGLTQDQLRERVPAMTPEAARVRGVSVDSAIRSAPGCRVRRRQRMPPSTRR
jgi:hypothetical protein